MEIKRSEIMPGVNLAYLWSDKFKTSCMSLTLLTQLQRDTASMNALIPLVLRRGTTRYPDMEAISARLDELPADFDVVFSNACIQWVPDHPHLIPGLLARLRVGECWLCRRR